MPLGFVRIKSRPHGGAPAHIRDQWIGLVLPVQDTSEDAVLANVLTHQMITEKKGGYEVLWEDAMNVLGSKSPETRKWWETNVSGFPALIFDPECCESIPD